jgi:hypothetical protein
MGLTDASGCSRRGRWWGSCAGRGRGAVTRDEGVDVVRRIEHGRAASRRQRPLGGNTCITGRTHTPPATCRVHDATKPCLTNWASCVRRRKLVQARRTLGVVGQRANGISRKAHDDPLRPECTLAGRPQRDAVGGDAGWIMDPLGRRRRQPGHPIVQREASERAGGEDVRPIKLMRGKWRDGSAIILLP